jgi:hypothetical protein
LDAPVQPLPGYINPEWMARFVTSVMEAPWKYNAERNAPLAVVLRTVQRDRHWWLGRIKPRWYVDLRRRELFEEFKRAENERIRQMLGNGSFSYNDKTGKVEFLNVHATLQPHTPIEHDMCAALAKHHGGSVTATVSLSLEKGILSASFNVPVPDLETVPAMEHPDGRVSIALKSDRDQARAEKAERERAAKAKADEEAAAAKRATAQPSSESTSVSSTASKQEEAEQISVADDAKVN